MEFLILAAPAYAGGCFVGSALLVRFLPGSPGAELLRRHLAMFLALPFLLLVEAIAALFQLAHVTGQVATRLFEVLAGRSQRRRTTLYYSYGRPSRRKRR